MMLPHFVGFGLLLVLLGVAGYLSAPLSLWQKGVLGLSIGLAWVLGQLSERFHV